MFKISALLLVALSTASAFAPAAFSPALGSSRKAALSTGVSMRRAATARPALGLRMQQKDEDGNVVSDYNPYDPDTGYWLGEWICADCGYIYGSRAESQPFETLGRWYKCPQCAGPRRRFAKKLGNQVGGADGDKAILYATLVGVAAIIGAFALAVGGDAF
ncbi:hypothetical protein T484DRAFT_1959901 [Baffinella frigidus]|nr:hypothetical protein T484DRAFT_1959901 [Cryptophyta sp. CCMP2293]